MKILISGANGLIGKELVNFFSLNQHQVFKLVRKRTSLQKDEIFWDIKKDKTFSDVYEETFEEVCI